MTVEEVDEMTRPDKEGKTKQVVLPRQRWEKGEQTDRMKDRQLVTERE